jgi:hypothetical protein
MTAKQFAREDLIKVFVGQARSTDLWLGMWDKNKDIGAAKNALTALGKLGGQYGMLLAAWGDEDLPEEIIQLHNKYDARWNEIMSHEFRIRYD